MLSSAGLKWYFVHASHNGEFSLGEAYARHQIACHWHLGVYVRAKGHLHNLCADFQALRLSSPIPETVLGGASANKFPRKMELTGLRQQESENFMFVAVGEVAEDSEGCVFPPRLKKLGNGRYPSKYSKAGDVTTIGGSEHHGPGARRKSSHRNRWE